MSEQGARGRSREMERFSYYLRYGRILPEHVEEERKFNSRHAEDGRFDFAPGNGTLAPRKRSAERAAMTARGPNSGGTGAEWQGPVRSYPQATHQPVHRLPAGLSDDIVAAARAAQRRYGVPASVTLAQFGLESAWGRRMPPGSNNPFGIKARPGEPFVKVDTWEQDRHGRIYRIEAKFRMYGSLAEAFEAHAQLLQRPAYATAQSARTSEEYADALTGVYATDRQYGTKLKTLIRQHGLDEFNLPVTAKPPQRP